MGTSLITKRALADSFIKLMEARPYDKINIADICDGCGMNRKSFYYHFKDKRELTNWILDTDIEDTMTEKYYENAWTVIEKIAEIFDKRRNFYRKLIDVKDADVFRKHFDEVFENIALDNFRGSLDKSTLGKFQLEFLAAAYGEALRNWLVKYEDMSIKEFIVELDAGMKYLVEVYEEL